MVAGTKAKTALYFVALVPSEPFFYQVQRLKEEARDLFQSKAALRSPPHITLHMPFSFREDREPEIVSCLDQAGEEKGGLTIHQEGFGAFPPRVIFIQVRLTDELEQFRQQVVRSLRHSLKITNADYKERPFYPHMTIAFRDLKKSLFSSAWEHFRQKDLSFTWVAREIVLLKHTGTEWQIQHQAEIRG